MSLSRFRRIPRRFSVIAILSRTYYFAGHFDETIAFVRIIDVRDTKRTLIARGYHRTPNSLQIFHQPLIVHFSFDIAPIVENSHGKFSRLLSGSDVFRLNCSRKARLNREYATGCFYNQGSLRDTSRMMKSARARSDMAYKFTDKRKPRPSGAVNTTRFAHRASVIGSVASGKRRERASARRRPVVVAFRLAFYVTQFSARDEEGEHVRTYGICIT